MKFSTLTIALIASSTSVSATFCLLGLPDPLGLCPKTTTTPKAVPAATPTPKAATPPPVQVTTPVNTPPAPVVVPTTTSIYHPLYTPPAAIPTEEPEASGPSTTLTVPAPLWDSTTTLLSVVVETSPIYVSTSTTSASVVPSVAGVTSSVKPSAAQVTTNAGVRVGGVANGVLGGLVVAGMFV